RRASNLRRPRKQPARGPALARPPRRASSRAGNRRRPRRRARPRRRRASVWSVSSERRARSLAVAASLALALAGGGPARAQAPGPIAQRSAPEEAHAEAKELFNRGLRLLDAGDLSRALEYFLRSRALSPGKGNTANAAYCLDRLGRFDEALELYEEL